MAQRIGGSGIRCRNEWEVEGQDLARYDRFLGGEFSFQEQRRERLRQFLLLAGDSIPRSDTTLDALFAVYLEKLRASLGRIS